METGRVEILQPAVKPFETPVKIIIKYSHYHQIKLKLPIGIGRLEVLSGHYVAKYLNN